MCLTKWLTNPIDIPFREENDEKKFTAMSRMKCIGAQSIPLTGIVSPPPGFEVPCRRDTGTNPLRTFFRQDLVDMSEAAAAQIPLFDEHAQGSQTRV